jgi:hypothetical protein
MRKVPLFVWLAALAVVALQAMALATRYFQPWLDGDYLLAERFAADALAGVYPLSGWTLSSSPYFFPDFALSLAARAVLGEAPLLPYYVMIVYVGLALLTGWSLSRVREPDGLSWLLGALLVNVLLAWQGVADHARWLWWLGVPTMHGGAVLLGLAQFALWIGPADSAPSPVRRVVATILLFLGLASDALLFTQFVAPLAAAQFITAPAPRLRSPRLRAFLLAIGLALALVIVLRLALQAGQWGHYPAVVRYAPTPAAIISAGGRMLSDLGGPITSAVPAFVGLFLGAVATALWLCRRADVDPARRQAGWFAALCLVSTLALPVLAVYWRNPQHGRYLLPGLVIPLWWLLAVLPTSRWRQPLAAGAVAILLVGLAAWRAPEVDFRAWTWPRSERVEALERLVAGESPARGLADFWQANYLNAVSRGALRLNQLRPDGRVQFWGNNAFHHFEADATGTLHAPRYTFIVMNGLDAPAIRAKFGPPARTANAGDYEVWFYDLDGAVRLSTQVDAEVRAFLGDRPGTGRIAP